jgi:hypothetical protein
MSRFLTQRADAERLQAYAAELEAAALEMEQLAAQCEPPEYGMAGMGEMANA